MSQIVSDDSGTMDNHYNITLKVITDTADFDALCGPWSKLLKISSFANTFISYHWLRAWWTAFGSGHKLLILVVEKDEAVIGIAPFMITPERKAGKVKKVVEFIGSPNADYADFVGCDRRLVIETALSYLAKHSDQWDQIRLGQISEHSDTMPNLQEILGSSNGRHLIRSIDESPSFVYHGSGGDRSTFALKRDSKLRQSQNWLNKVGRMRIDFYTGRDDMEPFIPDFFHSHIVRWGQTPTPSKFLRQKNRRFYLELVSRLAPENLLSLAVLSLNDRPIGYLMAFHYDRRAFLYTLSFSQYYRKKSPGKIMINALIEHWVRQGYDIIDFTRGGESYKANFCTNVSRNFEVNIYRDKFPYAMARAVDNVKNSRFYKTAVHDWGLSALKARLAPRLSPSGLKKTLKAGQNAIGRIGGYCAVSLYSVDGPDKDCLEDGKRFNVRPMELNDIDLIGAFLGIEAGSTSDKELEERIGQGKSCFGAFHDTGLVGLCWTMSGDNFGENVAKCVKPDKDDIVIMETVVSPVFEKPEIYSMIYSAIGRHYRSQDRRVLVFFDKNEKRETDVLNEDGFRHQVTSKCLKPFGMGSCLRNAISSRNW